MVRDRPRDTLPAGSAWTLEDVIPSLQAPLRGRGGYLHYSNDITAVVATAAYVIGGIYADQLATPKLLALDEDGNLVSIASNGTVTNIGAALIPLQNPVQVGGKVIITASDGTTAPKKYDTAIANLGGSPPAGKYAAVWKALLLLGNTSAQPQRVYFSTTDYNPETWDTTNTFWDFSFPVKGFAALRNAVLVYHDDYVSRLRGSTPPPGGDMIADDPLFNIGCCDARSIATWNEQVVWADTDGIYITDGSIPNDLTALCGMKTYWQELMTSFASTWTVVGGILRDHYFVVAMDGSTFKEAAMIDLQRNGWLKLTNIDARSMWRTTSVGGTERLFVGRRGAARVADLSTVFTPSATYKNDGDGDAVTPLVETPYYKLSAGIDRIRRVYVTYDLRDAATDNPVYAVSYATTPEGAYTGISATLPETTAMTRKPLDVNRAGLGVAFKIEQSNASSDSRLWDLELEGHEREASRH